MRTAEQMREEKKGLLRAIRRRNADLRRFKEERSYYKLLAESNERWAKQLEEALKIACETIPKELLKSGSPIKEPDAMMGLAAARLKFKKGMESK